MEDYPTYLIHYGVPGQKWGVRNYQNSDGTWTEEGKERRRVGNNEIANNQPPNTKLLVNYSGPAIFISSNSDLKSLKPRVPKNYFTENGYEDSETERISFAPSIDKCLAGLSQNVDGKTYTVYSPDDVKKYSVYKPNKKAVPDSIITDEMWICEPVKLKKIGKITVTGNKNKPGKKFSYGDKQAELYDDWTYTELKHSDYLIHYGVPGQKWGERKYQLEDGTWTEEGLRRRRKEQKQLYKHIEKSVKRNRFNITRYSGNSFITDAINSNVKKEKLSEIVSGKYLNKKLRDGRTYNEIIDNILKIEGDKKIREIELENKIKNGSVYVKETISKIDANNIIKNEKETDKYCEFIRSLDYDTYGWEGHRSLRKEAASQSVEILDSILKQDLIESSEKIWWIKPDEEKEFFKQNKRISEATDLAMKAAGKEWISKHVRYFNNDEHYYDREDQPNKMSFLQASMNYPDYARASGMVQIADLVIRGYSKQEIKNIIKLSGIFGHDLMNSLPEKYADENRTQTMHYTLEAMSVYGNRDDFIDKCIKINKNTLSDAKQSRIKSLIASGKSQEEVAKMLGISTSTVNKYK